MAVEITPTVGCATCAAPLCPACLGCVAAGHEGGCLCPTVEYSAERVAARRAWLAGSRRLGAHLDDCFACNLEWLPGCEDGRALRHAADAAWERYDGVGR